MSVSSYAAAQARPLSQTGRQDCVACGRPYGRRRAPRVEGDALIDVAALVVCDQCWHLSGGTEAITTRLNSGTLEPALVFDPAVEQLLAEADEYDLLHPIDRLLVESGVRWSVLRHIVPPARMNLAGRVMRQPSPAGTCSADSPRTWMDAVEERICARTGPGAEFAYRPKKRRWWQIARELARCSDHDTRPLTWITQDELAALAGCTTRTVRRAIKWLRSEGLLREVVPGCRLPQQRVPDAETPAETEERHRRVRAAIAAEEAAMARARAEIGAVHAGHLGAAAAAAAEATLPHEDLDTHDDTTTLIDELVNPPLVHLAPVYELRVPVDDPRTSADKPRTRENAGGEHVAPQNVHPPGVSNQKIIYSGYVQPVDNRRAPRGSDAKGAVAPDSSTARECHLSAPEPVAALTEAAAAGQKPRTQQSEAVRAAEWLLTSRLDPRVCDQVSLRSLAAQIRGAHLLDRHGWTWEDLADLIHGVPEYRHLPRWIRDPRRWIRARFRDANPTLPPSTLRTILDIERNSPLLQRQRRAEHEASRAADIAHRRAAIAACRLCDEVGWLHVPAGHPTAACNHDLLGGGW